MVMLRETRMRELLYVDAEAVRLSAARQRCFWGAAEELYMRRSYPQGPRLWSGVARDWDGRSLVWNPLEHLSTRVRIGYKLGDMRTFSGYSKAFTVFSSVLSDGSRKMILDSAFGPIVTKWREVSEKGVTAHLALLRALMDRFWDTTNMFHMPGYEVGITFTSLAVVSGLPHGGTLIPWELERPAMSSRVVLDLVGDGILCPADEEHTFQPRTRWFSSFYQGEGKKLVSEISDEQSARLWLWWFLCAVHFGDKGARASTAVLLALSDLSRVGEYDWVTPALGVLTRFCRDAVRPDRIDSGSRPSLVGPGLLMEAWCYAHFPSLLPAGRNVTLTYPAFHCYATMAREGSGMRYETARKAFNAMTVDKFVAKPWGGFAGVPPTITARFGALDRRRLYIESHFDSYWFLGERMSGQTGDKFVVPADPPKVLFEQTPDANVRRVRYHEGESDSLLRPGENYELWARRSLAPAVVEPRDPDMEFQPPPFHEDLVFEHDRCPHRFELPPCSTSVADGEWQRWGSQVKKVAGAVHRRLWQAANRWRTAFNDQAVELCTSRRKIEQMEVERVQRDREFAREREARLAAEARLATEAETEARLRAEFEVQREQELGDYRAQLDALKEQLRRRGES